MNKRVKSERRQYPRIKHTLPLKIGANGYNLSTTTKDLSCVGTYCHIDKYIPPFTKIAIKIALPTIENNAKKECGVECKGVIVRTEDEPQGGFNLAILFNQIKDTERQKISQYVNRLLSL